MNPSYSGELIPANTGLTQSVENQIADYNRQLLELEKMQAVGGNNPRVAELKESIASQRQSIVRSIDNAVAGLRVRLRDASASEQRAQSRVTTIPTKEREMLSLERKQKIKESLYLFLLNRREENSLSQAMADNNARVIDEAVGVGPVSPKRNQILLLGLMAGFLLPALILIIKVFLDNKVRTHKDLTRGLTIPYLGSVPSGSGAPEASAQGSETRTGREGQRGDEDTAHEYGIHAQRNSPDAGCGTDLVRRERRQDIRGAELCGIAG